VPVAEAALAFVASKVLDQLAGEVGGVSSRRVRSWLGRDPQRFACQVALAQTEARFAERHPDWHRSLFDEHFLKTAAFPLLARSLTRGGEATAAEVAEAWAHQFRREGETGVDPNARRRTEEATQVAADLLRIWREEVGRHDVFRPVLDSAALEQLSDSAVRMDDVRAALGDLDRVLLRARYPALEDYVDWPSRSAIRTRGPFVGREWLFAQLSELAARSRAAYVSIEADAGLGKTALAVALAARHGAPLFLFGEAAGRVRSDQCLNHLCVELIDRFELQHDRLPDRAGDDSGMLSRLLEEAVPSGQVWVVIDALDEAASVPLPDELPTGAYVVLTHRPGDYAPGVRPGTAHHRLRITSADDRQRSDVLTYLTQRLQCDDAVRAVVAEPGGIERLARASDGNFMYLAYLLEELGDAQALDLDALPRGLSGYYQRMWRAIAAEADRDWAGWDALRRPVIELLAVAGEPVTTAWLADVSGRSTGEIQRRALHSWRRFLHEDGERWRIVHQSFRDFLGSTNEVDLTAAHGMVAAYFADRWTDHDGYASRHLCMHLRSAGDGERLFGLVERADWRAAQLAADPSGTAYRADVEEAWDAAYAANDEALSAGETPPFLLTEITCALSIAEQRSFADTVPVALLLRLLESDIWTPGQVVAAVASRPEPIERVVAFTALVPLLGGQLRERAVAEAVGSALEIDEPIDRAWALTSLLQIATGPWEERIAAERRIAVAEGLEDGRSFDAWYYATAVERLAPVLEESQVDGVLQAARALDDPESRVSALLAVARRLSGHDADEVFADVLTSMERLDEWHLPQLLDRHEDLPEPFLSGVLAILATWGDASAGGWVLRSLAPRLTGELARMAMRVVERMEDPRERQLATAVLAEDLSESERRSIFTQALESVAEAEAGFGGFQLVDLAPKMPDELLPRALEIVRELAAAAPDSDEDDLLGAPVDACLEALAPRLADHLLEDALDLASGLVEPTRTTALANLAPYLPDTLVARAFDAIAHSADTGDATALAALAPRLPDDMLGAALDLATTLRSPVDDEPVSQVLAALAPRLPDELLVHALAAVAQLPPWGDDRSSALAALAPRLPAECLPSAIAALSTDTYWRASAYGVLAPSLQGEDRLTAARQALAAAEHAVDPSTLPYTVARVAAYLPEPERSTTVRAAWSSLERLDPDDYGTSPVIALFPHLSQEQQRLALTSLDPDELLAEDLETLMPHLSEGDLERMLQSTPDSESAAERLTLLAPRLPVRLIPLALDAISAVPFPTYVEALTALVPRVPPAERAEVLAGYRDRAREFDDAQARAMALAALAPLLTGRDRLDTVAAAAQAAGELTDPISQISTVAEVAAQLAPDERQALVGPAIRATVALSPPALRVSAIAMLAPFLGDDKSAWVREAHTIATSLPDPQALIELAPCLPDALVPPAFEYASALRHPTLRARGVAALAARVTDDQLERALSGLSGPLLDPGVFKALAPHLTDRTLPAALAATAHLSDPPARASAFAELAAAHQIDPRTLHQHVRSILRAAASRGNRALDQALHQLSPALGQWQTSDVAA
jgi:hypothetical protein